MNNLLLEFIKQEVERTFELQNLMDRVDELVQEATTSDTVFLAQVSLDMAHDFAMQAFREKDIFHPDEEDFKTVKDHAYASLVATGKSIEMSTDNNTLNGRYLPNGRMGFAF